MSRAGQFAIDDLQFAIFNFLSTRKLPVLFLLGLMACGDSGTAPVLPASPLGEGKAHFRGSSIGDRIDDVLKREPIDSVVFSIPKQVVYSFGADSAVLQVSYEFENDTLHTIQADWFFVSEEMLGRAQEEIRTVFDNRYARQEGDGDYEVWQTARADRGLVEFTLMEATTEYGRPVLSLTVYRFE
jgi:hypothetical protein